MNKTEISNVEYKIERLEQRIQGIKDDIEFFGGCSDDYQRIREWEQEIKQLKSLLPTNETNE